MSVRVLPGQNDYARFDENRSFFNSLALKTLSAMPVFGFFVVGVIEGLIGDELQVRFSRQNPYELDPAFPPRVVEMIEIKNHYKIADIVGRCLTVAIIVALIATELFVQFEVIFVFYGVYQGIRIGTQALNIRYNVQLIDQIQTSGMHPQGMGIQVR